RLRNTLPLLLDTRHADGKIRRQNILSDWSPILPANQKRLPERACSDRYPSRKYIACSNQFTPQILPVSGFSGAAHYLFYFQSSFLRTLLFTLNKPSLTEVY